MMTHEAFGKTLRVRIEPEPGELRRCVYCGETATARDFFPPRSQTAVGFILPACLECSGLCLNRWPYDFQERAEGVKEALRIRYERVLRIPEMSEEELEDLGTNLKIRIKQCQERKRVEEKRIAWNAMPYLACIDHSNVFAQIFAEHLFINELTRKSWLWGEKRGVLLRRIRNFLRQNPNFEPE